MRGFTNLSCMYCVCSLKSVFIGQLYAYIIEKSAAVYTIGFWSNRRAQVALLLKIIDGEVVK